MVYDGDCSGGVAVPLWRPLWSLVSVCSGGRQLWEQVILRPLTAYLLMTSADRNDDLVPAQEKLEWVTPQISLMGADDTEGKTYAGAEMDLGNGAAVGAS